MNARPAILEFFCWNIITFQYFVFKPAPQSQLQSLNSKTRMILKVCRVLINQGKLQYLKSHNFDFRTLDLMGTGVYDTNSPTDA